MARTYRTPTGHKFRDLTGQTFHRLTVVAFNGIEDGHVFWLCNCSCGQTADVHTTSLKSGNTKSCGCRKIENSRAQKNRLIHGKWKTPEWGVWSGMLARCHNPNYHHFADYGGRGILVCLGWRDSFANFLADMGERPDKTYSIDRKDNERGYDCGHCSDCTAREATANCRWATATQQRRNTRVNRRITFRGETLTLTEWAERIGVSKQVVSHRLKVGWPLEDALTKPAGFRKARTF